MPALDRALPRSDRPRRPAPAPQPGARLLRAVVLRAAVRRGRHADRLLAGRRRLRRAAAGSEGGVRRRPTRSIRRRPASSRPTPSSARASSSKSCAAARTCAASAGPATTTCRSAPFPADRILELAEAARPHASRVGLVSIALCDHPDIERILARLHEMGYRHQPGLAAPRRPHRADRPHPSRERRAQHHDRARDRIGSAAPRHQQDGDQRRDSRSRRADLRERHREPEAVLHDRPPDRNRRGPRGDSRSDAADARADV